MKITITIEDNSPSPLEAISERIKREHPQADFIPIEILKELEQKVLQNLQEELPDTIEVTIPPQEWDLHIYADGNNCYLAQALKKLGYQNVRVFGRGVSKINGKGRF